jgi:hypothetical protein
MGRLARLLTGPTEAEHRARMLEAGPASVPAIARPTPRATAASAVAPVSLDDLTGLLGGVYSRELAIKVPSIARGRDLIVGFLSTCPIRAWRSDPLGELTQVPAPAWCERPDPLKPRSWTLAGLADDLLFYGRGYLIVTDRYTAGPLDKFPAGLRWACVEEVTIGMDGLVRWTPGYRSGWPLGIDGTQRTLTYQPTDVVEVWSPLIAVLDSGETAIATSISLDEAARRFADVEIPAGWLEQTGGEPLTPAEMRTTATEWAQARRTRTVAMTNEWLKWHESEMDPDRLQLLESRQHQAIEHGRLLNVPAALLDAEVSSMTYSNQRDALTALWWLGAWPLADAIGQVLSGPNVTPAGVVLALDPSAQLEAPTFTDSAATPTAPDRPRPPGAP